MKYLLKFNESHSSNIKELKSEREDIMRVLSTYHRTYNDKLSYEIESFVDMGTTAFDRFDESGEVDEVCIGMVIDNLLFDRLNDEGIINKFLELYYDCNTLLGNREDLVEQISDIFQEYKDSYKLEIKKSTDHNDDRYVINITEKDILTKISFIEIISRMSEFGFSYNFDGNSRFISMEFFRKFKDDENL